MGNTHFRNPFSHTEDQSTKIILALFAGIAAGAILTSLLVSKSKHDLIGRLTKSPKGQVIDRAALLEKDASLPHPEEYGGGMVDVIIQAT